MGEAKTAPDNLEAVETASHPRKEAHSQRFVRTASMAIGKQWTRAVAEFGSVSYERGLPETIL